jgi:hypothetical protein
MFKEAVYGVLVSVSALYAPVAFSQDQVEPLIEIAREAKGGSAPSPASIEKAYSACLKGVDAEFAQIKGGAAFRREARKSEEEVCHRARRECVSNPMSASCKGFVVDYSE